MKLKLTIENDTAESPSGEDGQWTLYSFCRNDASSIHADKLFKDTASGKTFNPGVKQKLRRGLAFILDRYEHGGVCWSITTEGTQCQFDTARGGGILVWEHKAQEMGAKTITDRKKDARNFLTVYNDWANGNVYAYTLEKFDGEEIDSCVGCIGDEHLFACIEESIPSETKEIFVSGEAAWLANYKTLEGITLEVE